VDTPIFSKLLNRNCYRLSRVSWALAQISCFADAPNSKSLLSTQESLELRDFMNGPVRKVLDIIPADVTWRSADNNKVYEDQKDLMSSTVYIGKVEL